MFLSLASTLFVLDLVMLKRHDVDMEEKLREEKEYCLISLTQEQYAIVDVKDFSWLNQWKWCACWNLDTKSFYAKRSERKITIAMHRVILGLKHLDGLLGDHKNRDTLLITGGAISVL